MRAREPDPINTVDLTHCREEIGEKRTGPAVIKPQRTGDLCIVDGRFEATARAGEIAAIGVDVLSQQRDLANAIGRKSLNLGKQLAERSTDFSTTYRRNDAVGARVVTADLNGDPRRPVNLSAHRECGRERGRIVKGFIPNFGDRP